MTPPKFVTEETCNKRHGNSKWRLSVLTGLLVVVLAGPALATYFTFRAADKAEEAEVKAAAVEAKAVSIENNVENQNRLLQIIREDTQETRRMVFELKSQGGG